jgi:hypothetical protein
MCMLRWLISIPRGQHGVMVVEVPCGLFHHVGRSTTPRCRLDLIAQTGHECNSSGKAQFKHLGTTRKGRRFTARSRILNHTEIRRRNITEKKQHSY